MKTLIKKNLVSVYKSPKREEMYLYVAKHAAKKSNPSTVFDPVPKALREAFGSPIHVFDLLLTPEKKLARADADKVLQALTESGYYLQMPPSEQDDYTIQLPDELLNMNDPL